MRTSLIFAFLAGVGTATPGYGQTQPTAPDAAAKPACTSHWLECLGQRFGRVVKGVDELSSRPEVRTSVENANQITQSAWFQALLRGGDTAAASIEKLNQALKICDTIPEPEHQQACRKFVYNQARQSLLAGAGQQATDIASWLGRQSVVIEEDVWPKIKDAAQSLRAAYAEGRAAAQAAEKNTPPAEEPTPQTEAKR